MTVEAQKETLGFQTEVNQLLNLMINSLYSNKEIFLRELISNASDAADKLRFLGLSDAALFESDPELAVHVSFDKEAGTVTISDNGIGMTREDVIEHLGTIAKSGTKEFLSHLTGDQAKDSHLIGQFGVGFYSSFIVADRVTVETRKAGLTSEHGVRWISEGKGEYTLENIEKSDRGTCITLHLKEDEKEFLDHFRLRQIITKYSDHIAIPIKMLKPKMDEKKEGEGETETAATAEEETVNKATALWTLPKSQIKEDEYKELYKHISHDFEDPLAWVHNKVEGKLEYTSLLYLPNRPPFDLYDRDQKRGVKLYVQRTFIMDDAEQFLPMYLRFVKGVLDSNDLPLNISREILQGNRQVDSMKSALTKRVLDLLEKLAKDKPEDYAKFWLNFGKALKEGPAEDFSNKERIAKLLRFSSTHTDNADENVTLEDYVARMRDSQKHIYYVTAESFEAAKNSPHLEVFRKQNIEVLLLTDRVDEWLVSHLNEFAGKPLQSVSKGDLDLGELGDDIPEEAKKEEEKTYEGMIKQIKDVLGDQIKDVRITHRLTTSPACIVADDNDMGGHMQRLLQAAGQDFMQSKPIFEINPEHKLIQRLRDEQDDDRFKEWTHILLDQSILAEGGQLKDPATFVARLNKMLLALAV